MKVTVKQDRLFARTLATRDGMGKGHHGIVVAARRWAQGV
jgi:hypothetical protein